VRCVGRAEGKGATLEIQRRKENFALCGFFAVKLYFNL
jgi:hypothetical protein